jgi:hypothetical protein
LAGLHKWFYKGKPFSSYTGQLHSFVCENVWKIFWTLFQKHILSMELAGIYTHTVLMSSNVTFIYFQVSFPLEHLKKNVTLLLSHHKLDLL